MSIMVRYHPASMTAETYDATTGQIEAAGLQWPPDGMDYHVCFATDEGLSVSEVWDSQEKWQAFGERLMPVLSEAGIQMSAEPDVFEVHEIEKR
jgi:hypothetical protein